MSSFVNAGRLFHATLIIAATVFVSGCATGRLTPADGVIEPDALATLINDHAARRRLTVIDVRGQTAFDAGHIAGAVRADPNDWKARSLVHDTGVENTKRWREQFGALGISGRDPVVVYDDGKLVEAARIWFLLQHVGATDVAVLNGGYPALAPLIDAGQVPSSQSPASPKPTEFRAASATGGPVRLADRERTRAAIQSSSAQIFDARTPEEFTGKDRRKNPRGGHLPSAVNLPHKQLLDEQGRLKSPAALAALIEQAGFKRGEPIIIHCESGGRAALAALAAVRAGFGPVENYYRSFSDWSADATCPLEGGD